MPSTDRKLELKAKTSVAQTGSQPFVYAKGLKLIVAYLKIIHRADAVLVVEMYPTSSSYKRKA
jgi:hypothetical protein